MRNVTQSRKTLIKYYGSLLIALVLQTQLFQFPKIPPNCSFRSSSKISQCREDFDEKLRITFDRSGATNAAF